MAKSSQKLVENIETKSLRFNVSINGQINNPTLTPAELSERINKIIYDNMDGVFRLEVDIQ